MFNFLYKNAGIAVAGSRWCNEALPATYLNVGQNKASEYMTLSNQIKKFLASNLKTLSDQALDPIIADLAFKNDIQTTLNVQLFCVSQKAFTTSTKVCRRNLESIHTSKMQLYVDSSPNLYRDSS